MEEYFDILSQCPLFSGICRQELGEMLNCLGGKITGIGKGSPVFLEGDPAEFVGVVLSGTVQILRTDYYGNRSVLTVVSPGGLFGEAFACAGVETLPVSAVALQNCTVLMLNCKRVFDRLFQRLPISQPSGSESFAGNRPKEPDTHPKNPLYVPENHPGKVDGVSP